MHLEEKSTRIKKDKPLDIKERVSILSSEEISTDTLENILNYAKDKYPERFDEKQNTRESIKGKIEKARTTLPNKPSQQKEDSLNK